MESQGLYNLAPRIAILQPKHQNIAMAKEKWMVELFVLKVIRMCI